MGKLFHARGGPAEIVKAWLPRRALGQESWDTPLPCVPILLRGGRTARRGVPPTRVTSAYVVWIGDYTCALERIPGKPATRVTTAAVRSRGPPRLPRAISAFLAGLGAFLAQCVNLSRARHASNARVLVKRIPTNSVEFLLRRVLGKSERPMCVVDLPRLRTSVGLAVCSCGALS